MFRQYFFYHSVYRCVMYHEEMSWIPVESRLVLKTPLIISA